MSLETPLDVIAAVLLVVGCATSLTAGLGLVRFPDVLSRMHAATKPQVLGLLCVLLAVAVANRAWSLLPLALLGWVFMLMTAPVSAHMVGRSGYRTKHLRQDTLTRDDLDETLTRLTEREEQAAGSSDPRRTGSGTLKQEPQRPAR